MIEVSACEDESGVKLPRGWGSGFGIKRSALFLSEIATIALQNIAARPRGHGLFTGHFCKVQPPLGARRGCERNRDVDDPNPRHPSALVQRHDTGGCAALPRGSAERR